VVRGGACGGISMRDVPSFPTRFSGASGWCGRSPT
jgi:hypothetical protein